MANAAAEGGNISLPGRPGGEIAMCRDRDVPRSRFTEIAGSLQVLFDGYLQRTSRPKRMASRGTLTEDDSTDERQET